MAMVILSRRAIEQTESDTVLFVRLKKMRKMSEDKDMNGDSHLSVLQPFKRYLYRAIARR
jgi:hypothetical protein